MAVIHEERSSRCIKQSEYNLMSAQTILVVDDEREIASFVVELLSDEGYNVRVAHDGASALLAVREDPPDLVLLDVAMPVMTGDEVLRELRASGFSSLPIVIATAGLRPEQFLHIGATAILPKPFAIDQLLETVAQYV